MLCGTPARGALPVAGRLVGWARGGSQLSFLRPPPLWPRYDDLAESVEEYVLDMLRDQLNRRQPIDNVSRNLLRLLTSTCGYKEVRLMAVQRLEMWLQNPKVRAGAGPPPRGAVGAGLCVRLMGHCPAPCS